VDKTCRNKERTQRPRKKIPDVVCFWIRSDMEGTTRAENRESSFSGSMNGFGSASSKPGERRTRDDKYQCDCLIFFERVFVLLGCLVSVVAERRRSSKRVVELWIEVVPLYTWGDRQVEGRLLSRGKSRRGYHGWESQVINLSLLPLFDSDHYSSW
jgi:hypothetical protein